LSLRTERIGEQLRAEIARVVRDELTDPRVGLVTVTRVDVAPDLSNALVYWSPLEAHDEKELAAMSEGLASGAGFVRRQLAHALSLRRMPALRFKHDPSIEEGSRTLSILKSLNESREGEDDHGE